jgi:hypothetical protein
MKSPQMADYPLIDGSWTTLITNRSSVEHEVSATGQAVPDDTMPLGHGTAGTAECPRGGAHACAAFGRMAVTGGGSDDTAEDGTRCRTSSDLAASLNLVGKSVTILQILFVDVGIHTFGIHDGTAAGYFIDLSA